MKHLLWIVSLLAAVWMIPAQAQNVPALHPLCQEASKMEFYVDYAQKKIFITFDTGKTPVPDSRIKLVCYVQGTKIRKEEKFVNGKGTCVLPLPKPGRYNMAGMVQLDGKFFFDIFVNLDVAEKAPSAQFSADKVKLDYTIDPDDNTITIITDLKNTGVAAEKVSGTAVFNGKKAPLKFRKGSTLARATLALPKPHTPGKYQLSAELVLNTGKKIQVKDEMIIPSLEWMGNKLGMEDEVLPPWTPMTKKGNTISCLNREYTFGSHGLPTQIVAKGQQLLKQPIAFSMMKNGKPLTWKAKGPVKFEKFSGTKATIVGVISAGGVDFEIRSEMEYDGFIYVTFKPLNGKALPFDSLSLNISVNRKNALYRHLFSVLKVVLPKAVPEGNGVVESSSWMPFSWLGDNYRGLFWCCESDEMWPNKKGKDTVQFIRSKDAVTLCLNILKPGQKVKPNWKLDFMLQATPVKNYDARKNRVIRMYGYGKNLEFVNTPLTTGAGFMKAADPQYYTDMVKFFHAKNVKVTPYTAPTFITEERPEAVFFKKHWWFGFEDPYISRAGWKKNWYCCSPAVQSLADFYVWSAKNFVEAHKLNGYYYDQLHPYANAGKNANVGYEENGIFYPTYPIRAQRQLFKRMYSVIKKQPWETWIWGHMSAKLNIPVLSWLDGYFDGEHPFAAWVTDKSYMEVMSLDTFRAEFIGRQWGIAPYFLPEMRGKMTKTPDATRELMAIGMVHDVPICRLWVNNREVDRVRQELDLFDYGNSDFYAYYDDTPPASTDMKDVYVSAYKHDNGSVLFVIANLSKDKVDRTGKVKFNRDVLKVKGGNYINWPDRTPLKANGDEITLTVPKMGYRMVVLGNPPKVELPKIPFEQGWVLTNAAERFKGTKGSRLYHPDGNGLTFRGYLKNRMFMHENSHDLTTGKSVVITFNAKGKGKVSFGLFLNKDYGYGMHGQLWKELYLTDKEQQFRLVFPITKAGTVAVRELFSLAKDAEIVIRNYKLEILDSDKVVETPEKQLPITRWTFTNLEAARAKDQYLKVSGDSVELNGKKYLIYFNPTATKVTPGMFAEITFKASGKGKIPFGFISYTDYKYSGAKTISQTVNATSAAKQHRIVFKITDSKVKQVRPMIIVPQGANVKVSDYRFEIKKETADFSRLTKWTFAYAALAKEKDQLVKLNHDSIEFTGKKYFIYFDPSAVKVKPGTFVTIRFKASGKGKASFGFFSYTDYGYGGFKVVSKPVDLTPEMKQNGIMFQITDPKVKQIRPLIIMPKDSEVKIFDYQIDIK